MRAPEWQPLRNGVAIVRPGLGKPLLQVISVVPAHNAFHENPGHDGSRGDPYVVEERSEADPGQRCRQLHRVPDIAVDPRRDEPPRRVEWYRGAKALNRKHLHGRQTDDEAYQKTDEQTCPAPGRKPRDGPAASHGGHDQRGKNSKRKAGIHNGKEGGSERQKDSALRPAGQIKGGNMGRGKDEADAKHPVRSGRDQRGERGEQNPVQHKREYRA